MAYVSWLCRSIPQYLLPTFQLKPPLIKGGRGDLRRKFERENLAEKTEYRRANHRLPLLEPALEAGRHLGSPQLAHGLGLNLAHPLAGQVKNAAHLF